MPTKYRIQESNGWFYPQCYSNICGWINFGIEKFESHQACYSYLERVVKKEEEYLNKSVSIKYHPFP
jgi:hypothetical protein